MRIISPFHDYYDGAMAQGQDMTLVYMRKPVISREHSKRLLEMHEGPSVRVHEYFGGGEDSATKAILFFCGKMYPFYQAEVYERSSLDHPQRRSINSFERRFDKHVAAPKRVTWFEKTRKETDYRKFLENSFGQPTNVNVELSCPIIVIRAAKIGEYSHGEINYVTEMNPCLRDLGFQRVLEPYMVFQEISMYLGGVLAQNRDPISPMTDKEKVISRGMDPRYGFRRMPRR